MSSSPPPVARDLLDRAVNWTREAGELTLGWFNHPELTVDRKGDGTPVTQADRAAERFLRERILAAHPDDTIEGEEEATHAGTSPRTWVIDPIDGTKAFTHGVATYSNLLYMADEHGPALGVVNLPALGETVWAGRGRGCFFDGAPTSVSDRSELAGSYLTVSGFHEWTPTMFDRVSSAGVQIRTWGDAYGYALVASGRVEAMFDPILAWWDIAPMLVILPEANGRVTRRDGGEDWSDTSGELSGLATNGFLHQQFVDLLRND